VPLEILCSIDDLAPFATKDVRASARVRGFSLFKAYWGSLIGGTSGDIAKIL
jgi:hypothetical protein